MRSKTIRCDVILLRVGENYQCSSCALVGDSADNMARPAVLKDRRAATAHLLAHRAAKAVVPDSILLSLQVTQ